MLKKKLQNNDKTRKYLDKLPKIYIVGFWAKYGVREYPLAGWKKIDNDMIPLMYDYYDCNGMCDEYHLYNIRLVTTGQILFWTTNKLIAEKVAEGLNK